LSGQRIRSPLATSKEIPEISMPSSQFFRRVQIISLLDGDDVCIGAGFIFHGFPFFLLLEETGLGLSVPIPKLAEILAQPNQPHQPIYHLKSFKMLIGKYVSHKFEFDWR
jgi:hypothetical protein